MDNYIKLFKDRTILVTGGTGSIGSEIVRNLLKYPVKQVRVFSRDESKQFWLEKSLVPKHREKTRFLIGDIRDRQRVLLAMEDVDIVFNAAAMKHVSYCEYNPFEAVKTNVLGTQNLVDAARESNVEKFIHISTDKAAMPINVMGTTKLLSEKIVLSAENYKGRHSKTNFCVVRFGNVFGSRASVGPLFYDQIKNGGPLTLSDKRMTRFMMSLNQAVNLTLNACSLSHGGELFIFKMPVVKIYDLAMSMRELFAPKFGYKPQAITIKAIGIFPGEKIYEILFTEEEANQLFENEEMYLINKNIKDGFIKSKIKSYRSDQFPAIDLAEVKKLIIHFFSP